MKNIENNITESFDNTGISYTLSLINGKYKLAVLYSLFRFKVARYGELKRYISTISHKALSSTLKDLEKDNLITRKEYAQIPPKVEYSLSEIGQSFIPILYSLGVWGDNHKDF